MNRSGSLYIEKTSIFHKLDGSIKFLMLIAWTAFIFMFMDARVFSTMIILGFIMIKASKIPFKNIKPLVLFVIIFTFINSIILIIITPQYGSELTGTYTVALSIFGRELTFETIFFAITLSLKYISILPITLLFIFTTHPSRFASSLNRIGVSYKVSYAITIALRYIPDVKEEMVNIINAQEARGVAFRKEDANLFKRIRNYLTILVPLLVTSLNRVEVVSNAMDLRGFGRYNKRTWYNRTPLKITDYLFLISSILLIVIGIILKQSLDGFWYIF